MPADGLAMRQIKDILRPRHDAGLSFREIARCLNISVGVVSKYLQLATAPGQSIHDTFTKLRRDSSGVAPQRRHSSASLGRVRRRRFGRALQLFTLLRALSRLAAATLADNATDAHARRQDVRRILRPDRSRL